MRKYLRLFNNYFETSLEYRANLISILLLESITVLGTVILWVAIYRTNESFAGYSFKQTLVYYLLVPLIGFITQVYISQKLSEEIRLGGLSNYLLKPYRLWIVKLLNMFADKINYLIIVIPLYLFIVFVFRYFIGNIPITLSSILPALLIAASAIFLSFTLDITIAFLAFWTDDIWAFSHAKYIIFLTLGGLSFPFTFVHGGLRTILEMLPFKYLYYVPVSYALDNKSFVEIPHDLSVILLWIVFFGSIAMILWKLGIRKYSAYGA